MDDLRTQQWQRGSSGDRDQRDPGLIVAAPPKIEDPVIIAQTELLEVALEEIKLDFFLAVGFNQEKRRVLFIGARESGTKEYHPVIEQDIDVSSYWSDIKTGFDPNTDRP